MVRQPLRFATASQFCSPIPWMGTFHTLLGYHDTSDQRNPRQIVSWVPFVAFSSKKKEAVDSMAEQAFDQDRLTGALTRETVKKNVAAIHISGKLMLLQRKLFQTHAPRA